MSELKKTGVYLPDNSEIKTILNKLYDSDNLDWFIYTDINTFSKESGKGLFASINAKGVCKECTFLPLEIFEEIAIIAPNISFGGKIESKYSLAESMDMDLGFRSRFKTNLFKETAVFENQILSTKTIDKEANDKSVYYETYNVATGVRTDSDGNVCNESARNTEDNSETNDVDQNNKNTHSKGFECKICGYYYGGEKLPEDFSCPICRYSADYFVKKQ